MRYIEYCKKPSKGGKVGKKDVLFRSNELVVKACSLSELTQKQDKIKTSHHNSLVTSRSEGPIRLMKQVRSKNILVCLKRRVAKVVRLAKQNLTKRTTTIPKMRYGNSNLMEKARLVRLANLSSLSMLRRPEPVLKEAKCSAETSS